MSIRVICFLAGVLLISPLQAAGHFWDEIPLTPSTTVPSVDLTKSIIHNITRVIASLRLKNPAVKIVVAKALPTKGKEAATELFNQKLLLLAAPGPQAVVVAQTDRDFDPARDRGGDGMFPSPDGARRIALALADAIHSTGPLPQPPANTLPQ